MWGFLLLGCVACGILVPQPGIEPGSSTDSTESESLGCQEALCMGFLIKNLVFISFEKQKISLNKYKSLFYQLFSFLKPNSYIQKIFLGCYYVSDVLGRRKNKDIAHLRYFSEGKQTKHTNEVKCAIQKTKQGKGMKSW